MLYLCLFIKCCSHYCFCRSVLLDFDRTLFNVCLCKRKSHQRYFIMCHASCGIILTSPLILFSKNVDWVLQFTRPLGPTFKVVEVPCIGEGDHYYYYTSTLHDILYVWGELYWYYEVFYCLYLLCSCMGVGYFIYYFIYVHPRLFYVFTASPYISRSSTLSSFQIKVLPSKFVM